MRYTFREGCGKLEQAGKSSGYAAGGGRCPQKGSDRVRDLDIEILQLTLKEQGAILSTE